MGQLFNRIINFAKSELSDSEPQGSHSVIDNSDNELKKIIDELNRSKSNPNSSKYKSSEQNQRPKQNQNQTMTPDFAFSLLQVNASASADEIKAAYKKLILEYHPDRVATLGDEIKQLAEQKTKQINEAYNLIKKIKGF